LDRPAVSHGADDQRPGRGWNVSQPRVADAYHEALCSCTYTPTEPVGIQAAVVSGPKVKSSFAGKTLTMSTQSSGEEHFG
jgi:hypothetical protein